MASIANLVLEAKLQHASCTVLYCFVCYNSGMSTERVADLNREATAVNPELHERNIFWKLIHEPEFHKIYNVYTLGYENQDDVDKTLAILQRNSESLEKGELQRAIELAIQYGYTVTDQP